MTNRAETDQLSEEEIIRRRDAAIKRALNTPPKPHKSGESKPLRDAGPTRANKEKN